ncbi:DJ-1/PfpI family protein [Silanimonas sp.]|jgi:cyclohexyl-isocyanide hydratase|uniref:DJ-1/PfpI family protein n=1 Tax=Silanimonas sp. TaxID=1929290 RepID=UPI0037CBF3F0
MQRRDFHRLSVAAIFGGLLARQASAHHAPGHGAGGTAAATRNQRDIASSTQAHLDAIGRHEAFTAFPKATIGLVVYPGMFVQDLVGPLTVFEALLNREIHLLWKDRTPVDNAQPGTPTLLPVTPTTTFDACPERLDVLFVPGGVPGTLAMMEDPDMMAFLKRMAPNSRYVTSVCTGSFILGAAGLLEGYRAASYWAVADLLSELGAIPSDERVCVDRNRITGGGVTAGIDFGLKIAADLTSPLYAQAIQLYLEYAPAPPYDAGRPETAPAEAREFLEGMFAGLRESTTAIARRVRAGA